MAICFNDGMPYYAVYNKYYYLPLHLQLEGCMASGTKDENRNGPLTLSPSNSLSVFMME